MERESGFAGELLVEGQVDFLLAYASDLGTMEETIGDYVVDLAGGGAEDAGKMECLVTGEAGGGGGPGVGDEAATGHAFEFSWGETRAGPSELL